MKEIVYYRPNLIELPTLYSDLFSYYSKKNCRFCAKTPKESAICLICGEHICFYDCESMQKLIIEHKNGVCGSGVLILMDVNSTYIKLLRDIRLTAWPSLYLDDHGEEDMNLR